MQLDRQAQVACRFKQAGGLRGAKRDALAKRIYRVHQTFGVQEGQHAQHLVHIGVALAGKFGGQGVGAQKGGAHGHCVLGAQGARHLQAFALVLKRQAVARFDLKGGHALGQQMAQAPRGTGLEFWRAGLARGAHGGRNATALAGDFFVAHALQALLKFRRAVAAIDQMRVAINQAWGDERATSVVLRAALGAQGLGQFSQRADPFQGSALHDQGAVGHQAVGLRNVSLTRVCLQRGQRAVVP